MAGAVLVFVLLVKPIVGVADNGDFWRVMAPAGLHHMSQNFDDTYFQYVNRQYDITDVGLFQNWAYPSLDVLLVRAAVVLNKVFFSAKVFDIRFLAALYMSVYLVVLWSVIRLHGRQLGVLAWILAAFAVLVFTDVSYIAYFNSLYGEPVAYVFLLSSVVLALYLATKKNASLGVLMAFCTAVVLLLGAKTQNSAMGIVFLLFGIGLLRLRSDRRWAIAIAVFCIVIVIQSVLMYVLTPAWMKVCNEYDAVFYGILKDSPTPQRDLEELGVDPKFAVLAGTHYFMKDRPIDHSTPEFQRDYFENVNLGKVVQFYLQHPGRLVTKLGVAAEHGFTVSFRHLGTYEKSDDVPPRMVARVFDYWSRFKADVLPHSLLFVVLFYVAFLGVLGVNYARSQDVHQRIYIEVLGMVAILGGVQFVISIIGDGELDLAKHLFLFGACFDIMSVAGVMWVANVIRRRIRRCRAASRSREG